MAPIEPQGTAAVPRRLPPAVRAGVGVAAMANLFVAAAFVAGHDWAVRLWPWETGRLSLLFLAAMLTAIGTAAAWVAVSGESASLPAGFGNLAVTLGGTAAFLLSGGAEVGPATWFGVLVAVLAVVNLVAAAVTWRLLAPPPRGSAEAKPLPRLVRVSYAAFSAVLLAVGTALLLGVDGVMPWPVDADTGVVFGWIFFGDAFYFAASLIRPDWRNARAQLWSFLGYDLVLTVPLLLHLRTVDPGLRLNLIAYLAVLLYSTVLAVRYLLLDPVTRGWSHPRPRRRATT